MNDTFFAIFRNSFIKKLIRNKIFQDSLLDVDTERLKENHRFLSLFSEQDKLENNIYIGLLVDSRQKLIQYYNDPYKYLINKINILDIKGIEIDFNHFRNIVVLEFFIGHDSVLVGEIPDSITDLKFKSNEIYGGHYCDWILSKLPRNLKKLSIPERWKMVEKTTCDKTYILPETLSDLCYIGTYNDYNFVFPKNGHAFKSFQINIHSLEALKWVENNTCVSKIFIVNLPDCPAVTCDLIPSHVKDLCIWDKIPIHGIPDTIDSFHYRDFLDDNLKLPSHLKSLDFLGFASRETPLLEKDVFPSSLKDLSIWCYNSPLAKGVLPCNLSILKLEAFNQQLCQGVLPSTLTSLSMSDFNQPLEPFVLPPRLTKLYAPSFKNTLSKNSLPSSLTILDIDEFSGSFEHVSPLDHLTRLCVGTLNASVKNILLNVVKIKIHLDIIGPDLDLHDNTSIQELGIECHQSVQGIRAECLPANLQIFYTIALEIRGGTYPYPFKLNPQRNKTKQKR
ncbi:hypothetical protein CYY_000211 [Polysphondylium violaceum]|uniref:Uncharacterized protein n=1 Tax=Polysphondylium violaceum TaxID=133409 RepID=A0A8J4QBD2_9MYCE|nr:hypothetical protein CYY_000211 [Polysphondylium violaceum]